MHIVLDLKVNSAGLNTILFLHLPLPQNAHFKSQIKVKLFLIIKYYLW